MAVRDDFASGEVLTATDLNDTFGAKQADVLTTKGDLATFGTAVARLGVGSDDQVLVADSGETLGMKWADVAAGGKILQIVRATDSTNRSTTSTSFVDANISVTITPTKATSAIILMHSARVSPPNDERMAVQITDSSNNAISGLENASIGGETAGLQRWQYVGIAYATPATTSSVTYKVRFSSIDGGSVSFLNAVNTTQLFAIEVGA